MTKKLIVLATVLLAAQGYVQAPSCLGAVRTVTEFPIKANPSTGDYLILSDVSNSGLFSRSTIANTKTTLGLSGTNTGDQTAAQVVFTPDGTIAATTVQAAIQEVRDEATGLSSLPTADNQLMQATGSGTYAWTSTLEGIGSIEATGTLQGRMVFNSYSTDTTLTADNNNSAVVQFTVAGEATMWDCETANVGDFVMLWARDAEKIEVVPASGDHFNLFAGTALTADYELDMAATAGTKVTLMCTADDTWSVYSETAACADGGVAD